MATDVPNRPTLSIVMPCYNEEECIADVVDSWIDEMRTHTSDFEMVVVNDGSKDSSGEVLDGLAQKIPELRVIHQPNAGHGPALRHALEQSKGEFVFHVDSDNQFLPSDFSKLWDLRSDFDYITGIRVTRHDAFHRLVITRILRLVMIVCFGTRVTDSNIPYKLVNRSTLDRMLQIIPKEVFAPSVFMTICGAKLFRFKELPVTHLPRETGEVSIVRLGLLKACWRSFKELLAFRSALRVEAKSQKVAAVEA